MSHTLNTINNKAKTNKFSSFKTKSINSGLLGLLQRTIKYYEREIPKILSLEAKILPFDE